MIEFFAENALEHERVGETIDRIGITHFLEGVGVDIDPNMISHPRTNSFVRTDDFDEAAEQWEERKKRRAAGEDNIREDFVAAE